MFSTDKKNIYIYYTGRPLVKIIFVEVPNFNTNLKYMTFADCLESLFSLLFW